MALVIVLNGSFTILKSNVNIYKYLTTYDKLVGGRFWKSELILAITFARQRINYTSVADEHIRWNGIYEIKNSACEGFLSF